MSDSLLNPSQQLVRVEPDQPPSEPRHQISSRIAAWSTLRLLVGYDLDSPPLFETKASKWTAATREFGYWMIGGLEATRQLWLRTFREYRERPPGTFRQTFRGLRRRLVGALLLPSYQLPPAGSRTPWDVAEPGFEASRLVFEVKAGKSAFTVICHVFAQRQGDVGKHLLERFIAGINFERNESTLCDVRDLDSRLCLWARSSLRFRRRQYWEITIGLPERIMDHNSPKSMNGSANGNGSNISPAEGRMLIGAPTVEGVTVKDADDLVIGSELPDAEAMRRINERAAFDWKFLKEKIREATQEGRALDDELVETLAQQRYEEAREKFPARGNGLTLESSRRIVREVVEMHRIASRNEAE